MRPNYEPAPEYPDTYHVAGWPAAATYVVGWETEPDEETEWTGEEIRTNWLLVCMVGDDRWHRVEPDDLETIREEDYCSVCGQMGCTHDGRVDQ